MLVSPPWLPHPPTRFQDFMGLWGWGEGQAEAPVECVGDSNGGFWPSVVLSRPPEVLVRNVLLEHSHAHSCSLPMVAFSVRGKTEPPQCFRDWQTLSYQAPGGEVTSLRWSPLASLTPGHWPPSLAEYERREVGGPVWVEAGGLAGGWAASSLHEPPKGQGHQDLPPACLFHRTPIQITAAKVSYCLPQWEWKAGCPRTPHTIPGPAKSRCCFPRMGCPLG